MNRFLSTILSTGILIAGIILAGCGSAVKPESAADNARERYATGIQKLREDDVKAAETNFRRAIALDKNASYGYAGMALLELKRENYNEARAQADRALKRDNTLVDAHAVKGRVLSIQRKGNDWYEHAMASLERAIELDESNQQALYFAGECNLAARHYSTALEYFSLAAEQGGIYDTNISGRIVLLKKILLAGDLSENGAKIALDDKIDRGDLAILITEQFNIAQLIEKNRADLYDQWYDDHEVRLNHIEMPRDVKKNPAEENIMHMLRLGIPSLDVFPDGFFYPDRLVSRARMATVLQDVLALLKNSQMLTTVYTGTESPFNDVHPDYYAFNAIILCTRNGIMQASDGDGPRFNPDGSIAGIDAILMLNKLRDAVGLSLSTIFSDAGYSVQ